LAVPSSRHSRPGDDDTPGRGLRVGLRCNFVLEPIHEVDIVLEFALEAFAEPPPEAATVLDKTLDAWHDCIPPLETPLAPRDAQHAIALLRGMTSTSGGRVAAAATSLPERAEEGRDYDYRYAWIRDQCYAGIAAGGVLDPSFLRTLPHTGARI
jgi:hypothetical protein